MTSEHLLPQLDVGVELVERAINYTRFRLDDVTDEALDNPTPCAQWRLRDLLAHMADGLDAFVEASGGRIAVGLPATVSGSSPDDLKARACALLDAWVEPPVELVTLGAPRHLLPSGLLLATAALEIGVHGWDVGVATGKAQPLPAELAADLLEVAAAVVSPLDRPSRFGPQKATSPSDEPCVHLLAFLGREP